MTEHSAFEAPPPEVKRQILASKTDIVSKQNTLIKQQRNIIWALALTTAIAVGGAAYAISQERVQVVAYSRDEVGFDHQLFLDTMQIDGDAVMMALKHFVLDWREVTVDPEHNKQILWRAFKRLNIAEGEREKVYALANSQRPTQTPTDTKVKYVKNISVSPRSLKERSPKDLSNPFNRTQWRVDWDEYEQDLSTTSITKLAPEPAHYTADVIVTTIEPNEEFPDGILFEPMMPEMVPTKLKNGNENAAGM